MAQDIVDHDTIHHLFPGLNKLLDFQRKFSIELEQQYELPWEQQRWGRCFSSNVSNIIDPDHPVVSPTSHRSAIFYTRLRPPKGIFAPNFGNN